MKSIYLGLFVLCAVALTGCSEPEDNALATDGATAEDFAQYEKDLAAVSGAESYEGEDMGE